MKTTATSRSEQSALLPFLLTVLLAGLASALGAFYPWPLVALCLGASPVALVLLWGTRQVPSPEERIAAVDLERRERRERVKQLDLPAAYPLGRAA